MKQKKVLCPHKHGEMVNIADVWTDNNQTYVGDVFVCMVCGEHRIVKLKNPPANMEASIDQDPEDGVYFWEIDPGQGAELN